MIRILLAASALAAASSLRAQAVTVPTIADLSFAAPLAGGWAYLPAADGSQAIFRDTAARPQLTIHCTRSVRRITVAKPASVATPTLSIWTSSLSRNLPASFDPASGRVSSVLSAYDPLLDAIIFSRGRFGASVAGTPALVVPPRAEIARVVEDCRS